MDSRRKYSALIETTLLQRYGNKVSYAKKRWYTILTDIKPTNRKRTKIYEDFIKKFKNVRKFVGDASVTTKRNMKLCKENKADYIGKIRKNIKIELFGKKKR